MIKQKPQIINIKQSRFLIDTESSFCYEKYQFNINLSAPCNLIVKETPFWMEKKKLYSCGMNKVLRDKRSVMSNV